MARRLVDAVTDLGNAFVADTSPLLYRLERRGAPRLASACDPLFDRVELGDLSCLVSTVTVAELFVGAYRVGARAVTVIDAFLRQPWVGIISVTDEMARTGALLIARGTIKRLSDVFIVATALDQGLPLVTGDRRLARSGAVEALLVADFA